MLNLLQDCCKNVNLEEMILTQENFQLYPDVGQRERWEAVPSRIKDKVAENGRKYLLYTWPALPVTKYLEYTANGSRAPYEFPYFERRRALTALVLAECVENKGGVLENIINGIWSICEETSWVIPAHNQISGGIKGSLPQNETTFIDLFSAETGSLIAWAYYLLKDRLDGVDQGICRRMEYEVNKRIITPYIERDDFWWQGLHEGCNMNNWNPWCTSNCLSCLLIMEKSQKLRVAGVKKAVTGLDRFMDSYPDDGGCDEGPDYWGRAGGSLHDCLMLLDYVTGGRMNIYDRPLVKNIASYITKMHISGNRFANFADSKARVQLDEGLLYEFGLKTRQPQVSALGVYIYQSKKDAAPSVLNSMSLLRAVPYILKTRELENGSTGGMFPQYSFLPDLQAMSARSAGGTARGFFVAAKGGHNGESHNHNDVGQFMVYYNGQPLMIDVGVERYTAKTFSSKRYEIWTMRSEYHNLPILNGFVQHEGKEYRAAQAESIHHEDSYGIAMDISGAYPHEAEIELWKRSCILKDGDPSYIEIWDEYTFKKEKAGAEIVHNFMFACEPVCISEGKYHIGTEDGTTLCLEFKGAWHKASTEKIKIKDELLASFWNGEVYRLQLTENLPGRHGKLEARIYKV